jgi:hypothetical protein
MSNSPDDGVSQRRAYIRSLEGFLARGTGPIEKARIQAELDVLKKAESDLNTFLNTLRDRVTAALEERGHNTAASLLAAGRWQLVQDGAIQVQVGAKKTMLGLTMNREAWKIVREALRDAGLTLEMTVVPRAANSEPPSASSFQIASTITPFTTTLDQTISTQAVSPKRTIKVFISHSSRDQELARLLIELLRAAIPDLHHTAIRCTSVPGYKLEGGAHTGPQLREELLQASVFIGLLTRDSLASSYVLFELGARWGANTRLKPLRAAGLELSELRAPLTERHVQSCDDESDLHQMLEEISRDLTMELVGAYVYVGHLRRLVELSKAHAQARTP